MELVTIRTFDNALEANIVKSKLESENIPCTLFDENIVGLNPLYNITVGGIKLKIHEMDVDRALQIIEESEKLEQNSLDKEAITCPNCQSMDVYTGFKSMKSTKGILSAIISFVFFVYPIYYKTVYKCKNCGKEFKTP